MWSLVSKPALLQWNFCTLGSAILSIAGRIVLSLVIEVDIWDLGSALYFGCVLVFRRFLTLEKSVMMAVSTL